MHCLVKVKKRGGREKGREKCPCFLRICFFLFVGWIFLIYNGLNRFMNNLVGGLIYAKHSSHQEKLLGLV